MFGLGPSAFIITKMMAAINRFLREVICVLVVAYIDNLLIQAKNEQTCRLHVEIVILVLHDLGYSVNFGKSALSPSQVVEHLGFVWDSNRMLILLLQDKTKKIVTKAKEALDKGGFMAGNLRSLLGTLESLRLATTYAALHYRSL